MLLSIKKKVYWGWDEKGDLLDTRAAGLTVPRGGEGTWARAVGGMKKGTYWTLERRVQG